MSLVLRVIRTGEGVQPNGLVQEHDGNVVPHGIHDLPIFPNQALLDPLADPISTLVPEGFALYSLIHPIQNLRPSHRQRLPGLWTH